MKAPFTFAVTAPSGWEVASNRPAAMWRTTAIVSRWSSPPLCPSRRTSPRSSPVPIIASNRTGGEVISTPARLLCRASLARYLDADTIFEVTRQGLDFFAENFDYPYPWGKYDQCSSPSTTSVRWRTRVASRSPRRTCFRGAATAAQYEGRANTILHEMAHMWFGDLVTMVWWDDLWLKESFADYMGALASAEATEWTDAWVAFANRRKAWAYSQDQLPTTHPIVADIVDLEAAKLNFDGITYAKGASVLKQLVAYVGRDAFFEGARRYFRKHEFGNTTLATCCRSCRRRPVATSPHGRRHGSGRPGSPR